MNDEARPTSELVERILEDARGEAQQIRNDAKRSVDERRKTLERRLAQIHSEADERIAFEEERLEKQADSAIALAESRARLETEDRVYRAAYSATRERLREMRSQDDYGETLRAWIVEAALGVGSDRAIVSAPEADRAIVASVLPEAERRVRQQTGREVSLELDVTSDPGGQGVVLRDEAGRLAFSNLVDDRLRRLHGEAQRIVYEDAVRGLESAAGEADAGEASAADPRTAGS
ncbi:MAG: V-type ATP synthase subunit E, partial [Spirochaetota bacterium]